MSSNITRLRDQIEYITNIDNPQEVLAEFLTAAELLMNHCSIKKGGDEYEIVDVEFYLYNSKHPDVLTYPREIEQGRWFFHPSGVDLSFKSTSENFGGILIRGIRNVSVEKDQILGPQKCIEALWNNFDAFDSQASTEYPIIIGIGNPRSKEITQCPRWISLPKGKTEIDKINEWKERTNKVTKVLDVSDESLSDLVFLSPYRFVKLNSIDKSLDSWKKYTAKLKL